MLSLLLLAPDTHGYELSWNNVLHILLISNIAIFIVGHQMHDLSPVFTIRIYSHTRYLNNSRVIVDVFTWQYPW